MSVSFLDYLGVDEDSTDDEDDEQQPVPSRVSQPIAVSIDEAFHKELRDLRNHSRFHEAEKIEQNLSLIRVLFDGAPQKLKGVTDVFPVKKFIEERMEICLPFSFRDGRPLLADDAWDFIMNYSDNILRILYNIHNPFLYPAEIMLKHVGVIFDDLRTKISLRLGNEHVKRLRERVGCKLEEVEEFARENPGTLANELRMRSTLQDECQRRGMEKKQIEDLLRGLPDHFLMFSLHNKQNENTQKRTAIYASRENSPEREPSEKDPEEEDEEDIYHDLTFLLPPQAPVYDMNAKGKKPQRREINWYRSDERNVRILPFIGKCNYSEYQKTKKTVRFLSDSPTRCFVWFRGTRFIQTEGGNIQEFAAHDHIMETVEVDYETYLRKKRFPMIYGNPKISSVPRAASSGSYLSRTVRRMEKNDKQNFDNWQKRNPFNFLCQPMRSYAMKSGDGSGQYLPGHSGAVERGLGELSTPQWKNLEHLYYQRMPSFCSNRNFPGCKELVRTPYRARAPRNYSLGVLMITDSILEEVNHDIMLNTLLCTFVPPMNEKNALKLLVDCREALDGVRDLVVSWGFERMALFHGANSTEAFHSLVGLTLKIRYICKLRCKAANAEVSEYDAITMPKFWIMTIPEEGELAPVLAEYNSNIRNWCKADDEFHLLDWAQIVSDAPYEYICKQGSSLGTERRLALLFRLCREKFDLLYRRSEHERKMEYANLGFIGNGPWLKNIYEIIPY